MQCLFKINSTWLLTGGGEMFIENLKKSCNANSHFITYEGEIKIYPVDENNIHHTIFWEHLTADKRFIIAALHELSDDAVNKLRSAAEILVLAEKQKKDKKKRKLHQKGEANLG